ncbi:MAG TPA: penicillin-binding protein [Polyangia bacterium]|nr:penicillin-binding protein [Polyangia bacterium]
MSEAYRPTRWLRVRLWLATGVLLAVFGLLGYRAWVLQVESAEKLKSAAESQYLRDVELPPKRGRILDRHGAELAASAEVDSVHCNPRQIAARAPDVARALSEPLHLDRRELEKKLRAQRYFTWIKRRITPEEARAVRELAIPGVLLEKEPRRYYPNRALGGPLIGWAGLDAVGQEGIELEYDRWLRGTRAQVPGLRDALGREVMSSGLGDVSEQAGHDLHTTIDRYLQFRLEHALAAGVGAHRAKAGVALALDPSNGEILAMAAVPSLNPNEPDGARERGARNRAVTDPFEPGSTMKTFSITGAVEAGVVKIDEHWFCENGHYPIGGRTIHDAEPIGDVTTVGVLAKSSNICTAKIAAREGRERLHDILLRFGFGRPTGVDLPGERAGQVRAAARMGPVETATMSFGQGLTATPLQVAAGYAAIANGGTWYRPHVMRRIVDGAGQEVAAASVDGHRVLAPEVAATMRMMLGAVTQKGGTAEKLAIPGYTFAGKTGTAQKVDPLTRHYSTDKWASSFVGFAPAEDPRLVVFVMIDEPQGTHYGSMVAGPVFAEVMADALRWMNVPPNVAAAAVAAAPVEKKGASANANAGASASANASANDGDGDGDEDDAVLAIADEVEGATKSDVPDFTGMSVGEALDVAKRVGLRVEVLGSGYATAQSPGPGAARRGAACRVVFSPPG